MASDYSVIIKKDYGEISFRFKEIMDREQINRNQLAKRAGIRFEVADRFYKGRIERLDMDVLARICYVLNCDVGELVYYKSEDS